MKPKIKKIPIILGVVLLAVFISLLIYNFFFKTQPVATPPASVEEIPLISEALPETKERLVALTRETVLGARVNGEGLVTFVAWDGSVNRIDSTGKTEKIGSLPQDNIAEVMVSADGNKVMVQQKPLTGSRFIIFNAEKGSVQPLPANTEAAAFNPDSQGLILSLAEKDFSRLVTTDAATLKTKSITTTKILDLRLDWTSAGVIALKTKPSGMAFGLLYTLDLKTKKTQRLLGGVYGLTSVFSPSGKKVFYSRTSPQGKNMLLTALDTVKKTEKNIDLATLPEKCVWAKDDRTIYCATLNGMSGLVMPDDYYQRKVKPAENDIIKLNLDTGEAKKVFSGRFDAASLQLSADETYIFFINKTDGCLYRLEL